MGLEISGIAIEYIAIIILGCAILILYLMYVRLGASIDKRAYKIFEKWRVDEINRIENRKEQEVLTRAQEIAENQFTLWKQQEEKKIRQDAIKKSQAVTKGKITEHLLPYFPGFNYNPKDVRFLGSPLDLIVFDGLSEESLDQIVLIEVKTGNSQLSKREKMVRDCVQRGDVTYDILRH